MLTEPSSAVRTVGENQACMPMFSVTEAKTATMIAGTMAMAENQVTSRTCRRAPARPERRVATSRATRQ